MEEKWFAVANPASGGGRGARDFADIVARLRAAGVRFEVARSERSGHVRELAASAAGAGYRKFLAIGGDGTLSEAVNGVLGTGEIAPGESAFGLIPVGRGNDWARSFAVPRKYADAAAVLAAGHTIAHDVGFVEAPGGARRYFVNCAGAGFDAHVVQRTHGRDLGMLSYMLALPGSLLSYRSPELEVRAEGQRIAGRMFMAFASINRYCGGGMLVAPAAVCDDGLLDITLLDDISLPDLFLNIKKLYDGTFPGFRKVRTFRTAALEISGPGAVACEADGESIGTTPLRLGVLPGHVRVVVPA